MGRCSNYVRDASYAASARLLLAVVIFPRVLPGLRSPGHAATASPTPSKPSRPRRSGTKRSGFSEEFNELTGANLREAEIGMISATTTCKLRRKLSFWLALPLPWGCAYADRKPPTDQVFPTSVLRVETAIHRNLVEN